METKNKPYSYEIAEMKKDIDRMDAREKDAEREYDKQFDFAIKF